MYYQEKYVDKKSPLTGGRVKEIRTMEGHDFRGEKYLVNVRYYVCEDTGEEFTTTEQDTLLCNDLYSQYRIRKGIPFPEEIKEIRLVYDLNHSQISKILDLEENQYAEYESGTVPTESAGKLIASFWDKNMLLKQLTYHIDSFTSSEYNRLLSSIQHREVDKDNFTPLYKEVFTDRSRSIFNGYGFKFIPKLFDMVRYLVINHGPVSAVKLNLLMYYSDFYHFSQFGASICGLEYRALDLGAAPEQYETIYDNVPNLKKIATMTKNDKNEVLLTSTKVGDYENLTEWERQTLDYVISKLKSLSDNEIIALSQQEKSWQNHTHDQSLISYEEAFEMNFSNF